MASATYKTDFERAGYIDVPDLFQPEEMDELRRRTRDVAEERVMTYPVEHLEFEPGKEGIRSLSAVRKLNACAEVDEVFARFSRHERVLDIIELLLGPDIKLFGSQAFMKPPGGIAKTYHQDSPYFSIEPMALVTCWIALDDTTIENGCLWVIPGSHKLGSLPHSEPWMVGDRVDMRIPELLFDRSREVPITMPAGSCSFHHSLLLHGSRPNTTPHSRRGLAYHYMTARSRWTDPDRPHPDYPLLRRSLASTLRLEPMPPGILVLPPCDPCHGLEHMEFPIIAGTDGGRGSSDLSEETVRPRCPGCPRAGRRLRCLLHRGQPLHESPCGAALSHAEC